MTDPLASWWVHPVVIVRAVGVYGAPGSSETALGFVRDGAKLVLAPDGQQIVSSAQVALPEGTAYVPPGAQVTLPAQFGGRTCTVITTMVGDGGGQPTPDHIELALA